MAKPLMVERAPLLFSILTIVGILMSSLGLAGVLTGSIDLRGWEYWILVIGVGILIVGLLWMMSYLSRVSRFYELLEEESKANFIKNMDNIEYLAWRLPSKFEDLLNEKKRGFGIRS